MSTIGLPPRPFHSYDLFCLKLIESIWRADPFFFLDAEFTVLPIRELSSVYRSYFLFPSFEDCLSSEPSLWPYYLIASFLDGVSDHLSFLFSKANPFDWAGSGTECVPSIDFLFLSTTLAGRSMNEGIIQIVALPLLHVVWLPLGWELTTFLPPILVYIMLWIVGFLVQNFFWLVHGWQMRLGDLSLRFLFLQVLGRAALRSTDIFLSLVSSSQWSFDLKVHGTMLFWSVHLVVRVYESSPNLWCSDLETLSSG